MPTWPNSNNRDTRRQNRYIASQSGAAWCIHVLLRFLLALEELFRVLGSPLGEVCSSDASVSFLISKYLLLP